MVAQRDVAHKANEIPEVRKLLEPLDLLPVREGIWPHAQVFLVERYLYNLHGILKSAVAALGLTALTAAQASPNR